MKIRTSNKILTSRRPFVPGGPYGVLQAGTSSVDTDGPDASSNCERGPVRAPVDRDASQKTLKGAPESHRTEADRQAIERGEDEGMLIGPDTSLELCHAQETQTY
jgi:hypothetical protein